MAAAPAKPKLKLDETKDDYIKFGDLVFFLSNEKDNECYFYGDGVKARCGGRPKNEEGLEENFSNAIFRVQPKLEYSAESDLRKFLKGKSIEEQQTIYANEITRLKDAVDLEKQLNEREEQDMAGQVVLYGQVVQLLHFGTNNFLAGNKQKRAELDPAALRIELHKGGSKVSWFKISPRFKVRNEGEKVHKGDQIVLIHVQTGQFIQLSDKRFDDDKLLFEVNLYNSQTSWIIDHFAKFLPESENIVKGGSVVRLFHPEADGHLQAKETPIYNDPANQVFVKVKGKGGKLSSNDLFQIELKTPVEGGTINWHSECRLKHIGTDLYLSLAGGNKPYLSLTKDLRSNGTLFQLHPIDKGSKSVEYSLNFRVQHSGTQKWMHVGNVIQNSKKQEDAFTMTKKNYKEVVFTDKLNYQDALFFQKVEQKEIDEMNYVSNIYLVLDDFVQKLERNPGNYVQVLEIDTAPLIHAYTKCIKYINECEGAESVLDYDGLALTAHQNLLWEQQFIEKSIEILSFLFGGTAEKWEQGVDKGLASPMKKLFEEEIARASNRHIKELCTIVNKFLELMAKDNSKLGLEISENYLSFLLQQIDADIGTRDVLIESFRDNFNLVNNIKLEHIGKFIALMNQSGRDPKILEFLCAMCACNDIPVLRNQKYILDNLLKQHPQMMIRMRSNNNTIEINVADPGAREQWVSLEEYVTQVRKDKKGKDAKDKKKKTLTIKPGMIEEAQRIKKGVDTIEYFKQMLNLYAQICVGGFDDAIIFLLKGSAGSKPDDDNNNNNNNNKQVLSVPGGGNNNKVIDAFFTADQIFQCSQNEKLPGSLRAAFLRLLTLVIEEELPQTQSGVKLTWAWDEISAGSDSHKSRTSHSMDEMGMQINWLVRNLPQLKGFLLNELKAANCMKKVEKERNIFLRAALDMLERLVKHGKYMDPTEQSKLIPTLIAVLDGYNDEPAGPQRYEHDELNDHVMKCKLQICKIMHIFYDIFLEERVGQQLVEFRKEHEELVKKTKENKEENADGHPPPAKGLQRTFSIGLMTRDYLYKPGVEGHSIEEVLLDLMLYQSNQLTTSALGLLLRHRRPFDETLDTLEKVQLLTSKKSVEVYHEITTRTFTLNDIMKDNDISEEEIPMVDEILRRFISLCCTNDDLNTPNPKNQIIFRNLNIHEEMFKILHLSWRDYYHPVFKLCYLFLKQFCMKNKANQALLFPHLEFFLSQMGYQLNISDTLIETLKDNADLCAQLDNSFVPHIIKLIEHSGKKRKYIELLNIVAEAGGTPIQKNQDQVITLIMQKRDKTLLLFDQLTSKRRVDIIAPLPKQEEEEVNPQQRGRIQFRENPMTRKVKASMVSMRDLKGKQKNKKSAQKERQTLKDLENYEKERKKQKAAKSKQFEEEENLIYHSNLIHLLATCCKGENKLPEMMCQTLVPIDTCYKVLRDREIDPLLKVAYFKFISEVYVMSERVDLHYDEPSIRMWDFLSFLTAELQSYLALDKSSQDMDSYIFDGIVLFFRTFFTYDFSEVELEPVQLEIANQILSILTFMFEEFSEDPEKADPLSKALGKICECRMEGLETDKQEKPQEILARVSHRSGTMTSKTQKKLQQLNMQEKMISDALSKFVETLSNTPVTPGGKKLKMDKEFETTVKLFKDKLLNQEKDEKKYIQKLVDQLTESEADTKLKVDCLMILNAMINLDDNDDDDEDELDDDGLDPEARSRQRREEVQNCLGQLKVLEEAVNLFEENDNKIAYHTVKLACSLLAGGNDELQKSMMLYFRNHSDNHFFDEIHQRLTFAVGDLKSKRQQKQKLVENNSQAELDAIIQEAAQNTENLAKKREGEEESFIHYVLLCLQNFCEGNFVEMKDYLRYQENGTVSFNLVKETAQLAAEVERSIQDHLPLANQIFRTLTEFASGCPGNQAALVEAKIYATFNRIWMKLPECDDLEVVELKASMMELMISLIDGLYPEKPSETNDIPPLLLATIDLEQLEKTMVTAWYTMNKQEDSLFSGFLPGTGRQDQPPPSDQVLIVPEQQEPKDVNVGLELAEMNPNSRNSHERKESVTSRKDSLSGSNPLTASGAWKADKEKDEMIVPMMSLTTIVNPFQAMEMRARAAEQRKKEFLEMKERAGDLFSNCIIFLKILAEFDKSPTEDIRTLLQKELWSDFTSRRIRNIEIVNKEGGLQRVYFKMPEICEHLREKTRETLMQEVKRDSPLEKLEDFVRRSNMIKHEIVHYASIEQSKLSFISKYTYLWRWILVLLTLAINALMLAFFDTPLRNTPTDNDGIIYILLILAIIHASFSALMVGSFVWNNAKIIIVKGLTERAIALKQKKQIEAKMMGKRRFGLPQPTGFLGKVTVFIKKVYNTIEKSLWSLYYLSTDAWFLYYLMYLGFSIAGCWYPQVFAFHMLDIPITNQTVQNVLKAVTLNGRSILWTALLVFIIVYIYSVIGFFAFNEMYGSDGLECDNMYLCLITTLNYGVRSGGGIGDVLDPALFGRQNYFPRLIFDLSFFIIVIIILLNIVFGIILDTFGELREKKNNIDEDIRSRCFVCSLDSDIFQRQALGFPHHIKHEHNMWNYIYFFVHLEQKDEDEYTAAEQYVSDLKKKGQSDYFPIGRSISIPDDANKEGEEPAAE